MPDAAELLQRARLALFDIDGTMLRNGNRIHGRSIVQAAEEVTGHDITRHFGSVDAGGRTDRFIVCELLRRCGEAEPALAGLFDRIGARSVEISRAGFTRPDPEWVLEGVIELLGELQHRNVALGLVTGNLPEIAEIKLSVAGLWPNFAAQSPLITGYGDLSEDRNDLARHAFEQARSAMANLHPADVVIVGDTPRDIECAHAIGAPCLAVATGRFSPETLRDAGADAVLASLADLF